MRNKQTHTIQTSDFSTTDNDAVHDLCGRVRELCGCLREVCGCVREVCGCVRELCA